MTKAIKFAKDIRTAKAVAKELQAEHGENTKIEITKNHNDFGWTVIAK